MLSVELRVYTPVLGIPHSFIVVTGPDGDVKGYGLAPYDPGAPQGAGWIYDDLDHPYTVSTGQIELTTSDYNNLVDYINQAIDNPPPYDVYFGSQCANWAFDALVAAGIPYFAKPNMQPDNLIQDLLETLIWNPYTQALNISVSNLFSSARNWTAPRRDPLTFDLDGDGIETIGINTSNPILFDHDGDGIKTATGWIKADDAFLVLDRNGNGSIDSGRELFGDSTLLNNGMPAADGFAALVEEDTNGDGKVSNLDADWNQLRLWRDLNQDGISQANELSTLASQNIAYINVAKTENNSVIGNGNVLADLGTYVRNDGAVGGLATTAQLGDVDLGEDTFHSSFTDSVPLTPEAAALPNMRGSGKVRNLREAVSLSPNLTNLLTNYVNANDRGSQLGLLDAVVKGWSDTSTMATTATGAYNGHALTITFEGITNGSAEYNGWLDKLTILERFNGRTFRDVPSGTGPVTLAFSAAQMAFLEQSYAAITTSVYNGLFLQTRGNAFINAPRIAIDEVGNISLDFSPMEALLNQRLAQDAPSGFSDLVDFIDISGAALRSAGWSINTYLVDALQTLSQSQAGQAVLDNPGNYLWRNGYLTAGFSGPTFFGDSDQAGALLGGAGTDTLNGNGGDDLLQGWQGNDWLNGGADNDILLGNGGDDSLSGGTGTDTMIGGDGNDVYEVDDVGDVVTELAGEGTDTVQASISYTLGNNLENLTLTGGNPIDGTGNSLDNVISGNSANNTLNGGLGFDTLTGNAGADTLYGGDGNDSLDGGADNDVLFGDAGDDAIRGGTGADVLHGGDGNDGLQGDDGDDQLFGDEGSDFLYGGAGTDYLEGGNGGDTYRFTRGMGQDTIYENGSVATNVDTISMAGDISPSEIAVSRSNNDLILSLTGTADAFTVKDFFLNSDRQIESVTFNDNTVWNVSTLTYKANGIYGTNNGETLVGNAGDTGIYALGGNDTLIGNSGADVLDGGAGSDVLDAGAGNDLLIGGGGDDSYLGGAGDDTYQISTGDLVNGFSLRVEDTQGMDWLQIPWGVRWGANHSTTTLKPIITSMTRDGNDLVLALTSRVYVGVPQPDIVGQVRLVDHFVPGKEIDFLETPDVSYATQAGALAHLGYYFTSSVDGFAWELNTHIQSSYRSSVLINRGSDDDYIVGVSNTSQVQRADTTYFYAGAGNDRMIGNIWQDYFHGEAGNDRMEGKKGYDTYYVNPNEQDVVFDDGTGESFSSDTIIIDTPQALSDLTFARVGNDLMIGSARVERFFEKDLTQTDPNKQYPFLVEHLSGQGWDVYDFPSYLAQFGFYDPIIGTEGDDNITGSVLPDRIYGLGGNDTLNGGGADNSLYGGDGNDTLIGGSYNDLLDGGNGTDSMSGGYGDDTYVVDNIGDIVTESSGAGTDTVQSSITWTLGSNLENLTLTGTAAIDGTGNTLANIITGNSANNSLSGGSGNDTLNGFGGDDTLNGGTGADTMVGGLGNDNYTVDNSGDVVVENANEGTDRVSSSVTYTLGNNVENLTLTGSSAINGTGNSLDNVLTGNSANNTLTGGAGNDTLDGGSGSDTMIGGTGNDTYVVNATGDVVTENANEGTDTVQSSITYTLGNNVENLTLTGTTAINGTGNTLDNILIGNSANNTLTGAAGNDTLDGGAGSDTMVGGTGNDTYVVNATGDVVTENANEGTDTVQSSITYTLGNNVENLSLTGTTAINGTGNTLNNVLIGNSANNTLTGNAGNDTLDGGAGTDTLNGGTGNDTYAFNRGYGADSITDNDATAGNTDIAQIGDARLNMVFSQSGNNLLIKLHGTTDQLTIQNWFAGTANHIEQIKDNTGSTLLDTKVANLIQAMATFSAQHGGITWDQAIDQDPNGVQAVLAANWQ